MNPKNRNNQRHFNVDTILRDLKFHSAELSSLLNILIQNLNLKKAVKYESTPSPKTGSSPRRKRTSNPAPKSKPAEAAASPARRARATRTPKTNL